ncbi:hypothetical protein K435DRAFT_869830 [Dendrothele bispora CBS 962.96]|uniref:Brl1/Brr6 domain-containing protein n=1 Tax=Dendrothele bispora (strain CBS 962.96) TaxID=1314807 RepID=A0A4S8L843_DENBC|nr:hypothetical protein K435DRAFT_869830 [Dendrothele bispora CBS 962.96]
MPLQGIGTDELLSKNSARRHGDNSPILGSLCSSQAIRFSGRRLQHHRIYRALAPEFKAVSNKRNSKPPVLFQPCAIRGDSSTDVLEAPQGFTFQQAIKVRRSGSDSTPLPGFFVQNQASPPCESHPQPPVSGKMHFRRDESPILVRTLVQLACLVAALSIRYGLLVELHSRGHYSGNSVVDRALLKAILCARRFTENQCDDPVPALEEQCHLWQTCMDHPLVGYAAIVLEVFGSLFNDFFGSMDLRTLMCVAGTLALFGALSRL